MNNYSIIPDNWKGCNINDVSIKIHYGYTAKANENGRGSKYLRITDIQKNKVDWDTVPFCEIDDENIEKFELKENDIVFARTGGTVGKSFLIKNDVPLKAVFASYLIKIKLSSFVDKKYIYFFFQSLNYWNQIELGKTGLKTNVNAQILSKLKLNLAPFPEQRAIVSKIEQLFSDMDNGIENFKKAQEQLKIYRQAVLKNACEGKLVPTEADLARADGRDYEPADVLLEQILEERREKWNGRGKYKEPRAPDTSGSAELPEGWMWTNIESTGEVSGGLTKNSKRNKLFQQMPYIRVANVYADKLKLEDIANIGIKENEKERVLLKKGDLLVVEGNGSVNQIGRVALWDGSISPCVHQNHIIKVRFNPAKIGKYIVLWLLSKNGRKQITNVASSTSGLYTLNISKVASLFVPLPPLAEQHRIVTEIETRLSICDKMEETIAESLQKAESLRQSILKKAFEGKLLNEKELEEVRNAPDWEPADKLLERIKAQKNN